MVCVAGLAVATAFAGEAASEGKSEGMQDLFNGKDLTGWTTKPDAWKIEDGVLGPAGEKGAYLWTDKQFGDFALDLEFKDDKATNSGVFVRTGDTANPVQTGIEIQILDTPGKTPPDKHDTGAVYDCLAPSKNLVKPAGEWNHMVVTCKGSKIQVELNGEQVIDADLDQWTQAGMNPDGTKNKYKTAVKDFPRTGHIGLQYHGHPVWFRNIKIRPLD